MRSTRLVTTLVASGLLLLMAAVALSLSAAAAPGQPNYDTSAYRYTDKPSAAAAAGRRIVLYVDGNFGPAERERIGLAVQQWNHALNGFVQLQAALLAREETDRSLSRLRRSGWVVARVDSRHSAAGDRSALAVTVGNRSGGFIYVIADRFGSRDLTAVLLHEIGHVLGAGHDPRGHLMAPVYERANGHCIDRGAVAMVAQAQRLPLDRLNWCVGPGLESGRVSSR